MGSVWAGIRLCALGAAAIAVQAADAGLDRQFTETVRPFVTRYCAGCHSGASPAGQLDLRGYSTYADVVRDYQRWDTVRQRLAAWTMPPKPVPPPPDAARQAMVQWIAAMRTAETHRNAGDPGPVLARRLSNSEYDYTVRDLTGVDMRPAREFPVDPANPEGFDNSGESLAMSPALLNKYLQAAREVANHMVLTPDGFDFAPYPMLVETDREKYAIQRIVDFYQRQPTDFADYFQAAWRYKHTPGATLASVAAEAKLSPKYLPLLWDILEGQADEVGPVARLRSMWRALPATESEDLRKQCVAMRDFVQRIRRHTAMQFAAPVVRGLPAASQPLINWKFRQFNTHRRDSDPKALRNDTDPEPEVPTIPKYPGLHSESATRWAAVMQKERIGDADLVVPAAERDRYQAAFERFAQAFPDAFYIQERGRYFPDDTQDKGRLLSAGYHNVMGYWRDDVPLQDLILDDAGRKRLDRLWTEFDFISDFTAHTWVQYYFNQSGEVDGKGAESGTLRPPDAAVSTPEIIFEQRDKYLAKAQADPKPNPVAMEAIRVHFDWVNTTLRSVEKLRVDAEPQHVQALARFAERAYRRPLSGPERERILTFYKSLREKSGLTHEEAIRDSIVGILMSPNFCYRVDLGPTARAGHGRPGPTDAIEPLSPYDLASRLSYFLWSSMPDAELLAHAAAGDLPKPEVLTAQARRMLKDERARAIAVEFGGNWLDFRRFEEHNAVDRNRFPSFTNDLREAMFQEPVRFLDDVIRGDRSVLDLLYGNYTFVNPVLARHYGMPEVTGDNDHWVRVDDAAKYGRGGLLPMSVFLTLNAPGLRTSPVKRGHWVVKQVLGEVIPPPPAVVPELPSDEAKLDLPLREVLAKHRSNQVCASCHARFDSFGLVFEGYGPVGEKRTHDLAGHPVDTAAAFPDGANASGFEGLRGYIREHRQNDFIDNFCRKLLAYSLGRSLRISDEPEIEHMKTVLAANGDRFTPLVDAIVTSRQFTNRRTLEVSMKKGESHVAAR
jgi:Protein of unknown function (DUF1592)/Protein of unknown function (DUF1588)/Protein of unknown function (DUF1587)/Protein of unknown function (DUF1595)/Protein of unknown function (DUF1585)